MDADRQNDFTRLCMDNLYRQLEAFTTLVHLLPLRHPLPPMRGWAISPDFGLNLLSLYGDEMPETIVEFGSGVSTLLTGYWLQKHLPRGKIHSFEHQQEWVRSIQRDVRKHGLERQVQLTHAPLRTFGRDQLWYDLPVVLKNVPEAIDLIIVDGPPASASPLSRYPALPALFSRLRSGGLVILDDAARPEEQEILQRWMREYPEMTESLLPTEKGMSVLRKR